MSGALLPLAAAASGPETEGLYAVFDVRRGTNALGQFTCRLEYDKVPRTVANFVGLAEGSLPFVDLQAGHAARRPYYDGLTFHRVVAGFVIQGGSPNGKGTDGPGYTFPDEFHPTLRHSKAGILSMANSGLNSNGSQFFVTLAATVWLDDVHSVFGSVTEGLNVVTNVQQGDVMSAVSIVRIGAAARAFDAAALGVPAVQDAHPTLQPTPNGFQLAYPQPANTETYTFHSDDLRSWTQLEGTEMQGPVPVPGVRDLTAVSASKATKFFHAARVQYPDPIHTPPSVAGRRLLLADHGGFNLTFQLTNATSGTYTYAQGTTVLGPNPVSAYSWDREAYRGRLLGAISGLAFGGWPVSEVNLSLVFSSATNGTYAGNLANVAGQTLALKGQLTVTTP